MTGGYVVNTDALTLLSSLDSNSVPMITIHPPNYGDDINDMIHELLPIAAEVYRVLVPGGASVLLSDPRTVSAWEVVSSWLDMRLASEMIVLWNMKSKNQVGALATLIRWHVKPGLRKARLRQVNVASNVLVAKRIEPNERYSPTQLPVELYNFLITSLTESGDLVVDPMCGSGSALVAAEMCGREWVGGDTDCEQCMIAESRVGKVELEEGYMSKLYLWSRGRLLTVEG